MGRKLNLELPKYRLAIHLRLIKRRKPLVSEPIIPSVKHVNRKYRTGTILGKIARHLSEHKSVKKAFGTGFAMIVIGTSLIPQRTVFAQGPSDEPIVEIQNSLVTEKGMQYPLDTIKINQGFSFFHPAVDFGAEVGDPVKPIKAGKVIEAGWSIFGYGDTILIDHGDGLESRYAHLSKIEVKTGDEVTTNTEIGKVGITGQTTGPHLHLEILQNGVSLNPISVLSQ